MNIQSWFPLGATGLISLLSKGLSRISSSTTVQKHLFFNAQPSLWSNAHIHGYWRNQSFDNGPLLAKWCLCFLTCCVTLLNMQPDCTPLWIAYAVSSSHILLPKVFQFSTLLLFSLLFKKKLKYSWFTMLYSFPVYRKVNSVFYLYCFSKIYFLIEGKLLYNVVLVSAIHQHVSAVGIYMSLPSWPSLPSPTPSHPSRSSQSPSLSSLSHAAYFHWPSILYTVMCLFPCALSLRSPVSFPPYPQVHKSVSVSPLLPCK